MQRLLAICCFWFRNFISITLKARALFLPINNNGKENEIQKNSCLLNSLLEFHFDLHEGFHLTTKSFWMGERKTMDEGENII